MKMSLISGRSYNKNIHQNQFDYWVKAFTDRIVIFIVAESISQFLIEISLTNSINTEKNQ